MVEKTCPCGKSFFGRSNKIYCKPSCKSEANNARVAEANKSVDEIDKILMKNRKIMAQLCALFPGQELTEAMIISSGLNQSFRTMHSRLKKTGEDVFRFYEYNLIKLHNKNYKITKSTKIT